MIKKRIEISLTDEEYDFIKWMAECDEIPVSHELRDLFKVQLLEEMDYYKDSYERDKKK